MRLLHQKVKRSWWKVVRMSLMIKNYVPNWKVNTSDLPQLSIVALDDLRWNLICLMVNVSSQIGTGKILRTKFLPGNFLEIQNLVMLFLVQFFNKGLDENLLKKIGPCGNHKLSTARAFLAACFSPPVIGSGGAHHYLQCGIPGISYPQFSCAKSVSSSRVKFVFHIRNGHLKTVWIIPLWENKVQL